MVLESGKKSGSADPFTELAKESIIKQQQINKQIQSQGLAVNDSVYKTPIRENSTVVKGGNKIGSISQTPINQSKKHLGKSRLD